MPKEQPQYVSYYVFKSLMNLTYPIGSRHLHNNLDCCSAEVSPIAAHHHGTSLTVPQVDGGQDTLNIILQIVLSALKYSGLLAQAISPRSLVVKRTCLNG